MLDMIHLYSDKEQAGNEHNEEYFSIPEETRRNHRLQSFVDCYGINEPQMSSIDRAKGYVKKKFSSLTFECCSNAFLNKIPLIRYLKEYNIRKNLFGDIISGITVAIMHIPQGKIKRLSIVNSIYFDCNNRYGLWCSYNFTTCSW